MGLKKTIREHLVKTICANKYLKYKYFRLARFLSTNGICPPFSLSLGNSTKRWEETGIVNSTTRPENYVDENNSIFELFNDIFPYLQKDDAILEIGCNAGRAINYLSKNGFSNLTGIEISPKSIELMQKVFPNAYNTSKIIIGNAPDVLKTIPKDKFKLVFCHSVLVNIHPAYNYIFREMARVSSQFILMLENEGSLLLYPRDFRKTFENQGYQMIVSKVFRRECKSLVVPFMEEDIWHNNTIRLFVKDFSKI